MLPNGDNDLLVSRGLYLDMACIPALDAGPELCAMPQALQNAVEEAVVLPNVVLQARSQNSSVLGVR